MPDDLRHTDDVSRLVNGFYGKVRNDDLLGPVFNNVIGNRWDEHLQKMVAFWETVLLEKHTYFGRPFVPHARLPVNREHFDRWMTLFNETIDEHFAGTKADEAKWRASKMAVLFLNKIETLRAHPEKLVIQ